MKRWLLWALPALLAVSAAAAPPEDLTVQARVEAELVALIDELNAAMAARDRAALERVYADEFAFVHGLGYVHDRAQHLDSALAGATTAPVPPPSFEPPQRLHVYGDVAVLTGPGRGRADVPLWGTTVYAKKNGRWQIVLIQGTRLQPPRPAIEVDPATLGAYAGRYARDGEVVTVIRRVGGALLVQHRDLPQRTLVATAPARFVDELGSEWIFHLGPDGKVSHYSLRLPSGREVTATRED